MIFIDSHDDISKSVPLKEGRLTALERTLYLQLKRGIFMAADNKHHVRIVGFKTIDYKNKKTGAPEQMKLAQCVVTSETAEKGQQVVVGELVMPKDLHGTELGEYLAEFELAVGMDLRIGSRLTKLHSIGGNTAKPIAKNAAS
ncbi:hypothetical protein EGT07_08145 [Herbaspirillum sp. HC18]|nr:hypothetical protein EGT07_08145 [Herbaspirillum sp. HC18]